MAADAPKDSPRLRPVINPYVRSMWSGMEDGEMQRAVLYAANLLFLGLLGICGANVATLVFARTVTREGEITVRTALGASRGRIVSQLFAEALVLSSVAAVVGLAIASLGGRWAKAKFMEAQASAPPFWLTDALAPETLIYAALLALFAAAVVGIVPALKATGPQMQARLKSAGAAGPGMKFGGVWTGVIVTQVAVTVIFLMTVVSVGWNAYASPLAHGTYAFPQRAVPHAAARAGPRDDARRIERRGAGGVPGALQDRVPRGRAAARAGAGRRGRHLHHAPSDQGLGVHRRDGSVGAAAAARRDGDPLWVRSAFVGADFFETFDAPIVSGRGFTAAEAELGRPVAVVDQTFVRTILGGRDPVGLRVRQKQSSQDGTAAPWNEIVGVVRDLRDEEPSRPPKTRCCTARPRRGPPPAP